MQASPWCDLLQSYWKVTEVRSWRRTHSLLDRFSLSWTLVSQTLVVSFTARSSWHRLSNSCLGTAATFLICSSPWQTTPSPSLPLMTQVRIFFDAFSSTKTGWTLVRALHMLLYCVNCSGLTCVKYCKSTFKVLKLYLNITESFYATLLILHYI